MTDEQKDAIRWARDVAVAGKWEHVKALGELLAVGASEGQAEPVIKVVGEDKAELRILSVHYFASETIVRVAEITALRERIAGMEKDAEQRHDEIRQIVCDWFDTSSYLKYALTDIDAAIAKEKQG